MTQLLRQSWDNATRTVTEYDANGNVLSTRPYTVEENAAADAATVTATANTNETDLRDKARNALTANNNAIPQLENVANGTAALTNTQRDQYIRQLAQYQARTFRQVNALIKLEVRDLADTTGT